MSCRSARLEWSSPGLPNGIMGGYDIHRKALKPCEELEAKQVVLLQNRCSYLQCPINQDFCGNSCYRPEKQVIAYVNPFIASQCTLNHHVLSWFTITDQYSTAVLFAHSTHSAAAFLGTRAVLLIHAIIQSANHVTLV